MLKYIPSDVYENFHQERIHRNMKFNVLWPENQKVNLSEVKILGSKNKSLREIRILSGKLDSLLGYGIYGNKVAFISSKKENYGFIIDSKELSRTLKLQFDYWWKLSSKQN